MTGIVPAKVSGNPESLASKRVMVFDDDEFVRHLVTTVLSRYLGLEVFEARSGGEAIAAALTGRYDGAIIDLVGQQPGGKAIRTIRTMLPEFPMIGMAAQASDGITRMARQLGITKVLYKPFKMTALIDEVTEVFGSVKGTSSQA